MIVKEDGKQVAHETVMVDAIEYYRQLQLMHIRLQRLLHDRKFDLFGWFGYGTMATLAFVFGVITIMNGIGSPVSNITGMFAMASLAGMVASFFYGIHWRNTYDVNQWEKLLTRSESGFPLYDVPLVLFDDHDDSMVDDFYDKYVDPELTGIMHFPEKPLDAPVLVDGQRVIGSYVEVHIDGTTGRITSDYRIMLDDGTGVQVDTYNFHKLLKTRWEGTDGKEIHIPVLTGKEQSILWGAIGDMMVSNAKVTPALEARKRRIPILREAITDTEYVLTKLRK